MTGHSPSEPPRDENDRVPSTNQGMTALSYLIAGILVWGLIGWLVDRWLGTRGIAAGIGAILGAAGAVYLIVRRLGG
jgi:F0F1-type ATP synthase assembly protein I